MSLYLCLQEQRYQVSVPQNSPLNWSEHQLVAERSLFEPAEHPQVQRETDSESSRRSPGPEFQAGHPGSWVATIQRREAMPKCFGGPEPAREAGLPPVKNPARQSERQFPLVFAFPEPVC